MIDKNGKVIEEEAKCIVDETGTLGIVTEILRDKVAVLVLSENGEQCSEALFDPKEIEVKL